MARRLIPATLCRDRVLDIGCGTFPHFLLFAPFAKKNGIDINTNNDHKQFLQERNIELAYYDLESGKPLPFADTTFDAVTMLAVYEHIQPHNLAIVLAEIHRILRPSGICILTTPASWTAPILSILAFCKLVSAVEIDDHKGAYSHGQISSFLRQAGFQQSRIALGSFECCMNTWATATKEDSHART